MRRARQHAAASATMTEPASAVPTAREPAASRGRDSRGSGMSAERPICHRHHHVRALDSSSSDEGGAACATCDLIQDQFKQHDAWVQSLKESAEAVLATHKRAQQALAQLTPGDV